MIYENAPAIITSWKCVPTEFALLAVSPPLAWPLTKYEVGRKQALAGNAREIASKRIVRAN
jgi:hypothetical protein